VQTLPISPSGIHVKNSRRQFMILSAAAGGFHCLVLSKLMV
jgi:hypothetical protein